MFSLFEAEPTVTFERTLPDRVRIRFRGELDSVVVPALEARLAAALGDEGVSGARQVILDLTEVAFIDSLGVRLILGLLHGCDPGAEAVILAPTSHIARRVLQLVGMERLARIEPVSARAELR